MSYMCGKIRTSFIAWLALPSTRLKANKVAVYTTTHHFNINKADYVTQRVLKLTPFQPLETDNSIFFGPKWRRSGFSLYPSRVCWGFPSELMWARLSNHLIAIDGRLRSAENAFGGLQTEADSFEDTYRLSGIIRPKLGLLWILSGFTAC